MMLSAMKRYICLSILLVTCFHAFPELEKDRTGYILCRKKKATVRLADHKMPSSISHPLEDWNRLVALDHSNLASCILAQFGLGLWPFQVSRVLHRRKKKREAMDSITLQKLTAHVHIKPEYRMIHGNIAKMRIIGKAAHVMSRPKQKMGSERP